MRLLILRLSVICLYNQIKQGDEILVQVTRENVKTKQPTVSTDFSLNSKYAVLFRGKGQINISNKLSVSTKRSHLKKLLD